MKGRRSPVICRWCIQKPELGNDDKAQRSADAQIDCFRRLPFAANLADNIGDQEGRGKKNIAKGLFHAKGVYQKKHLNVGSYGTENGPSIQTGNVEKPVSQDDRSVDQGDGQK